MHHSTSSNSTFYIRNDWDCALVACAGLKLIFEFGHALSYRLTNHSVVISRESFLWHISSTELKKRTGRWQLGKKRKDYADWCIGRLHRLSTCSVWRSFPNREAKCVVWSAYRPSITTLLRGI